MKKLIDRARKARRMAYAPYSHFKVGAAIETHDRKIYTGCNVENASPGITCCAERVALFKAVSEGAKRFKRIAIVTDSHTPCPPCGACRQALYEFSPDLEVIMRGSSGKVLTLSLKSLLPSAFCVKSMT